MNKSKNVFAHKCKMILNSILNSQTLNTCLEPNLILFFRLKVLSLPSNLFSFVGFGIECRFSLTRLYHRAKSSGSPSLFFLGNF